MAKRKSTGIADINHRIVSMPIGDARRYLSVAFKTERNRHRAKLIYERLRGMTTDLLSQKGKVRHERA
ncbi:hypothetical protein ABIB86_000390 [Bradyrhizobium sp. JR1.7]|uniref:hypothetical protein n=1 Tax=unclassified Bradyrhizobium TaxID=2631580 RepID=UPI00339AB8C6